MKIRFSNYRPFVQHRDPTVKHRRCSEMEANVLRSIDPLTIGILEVRTPVCDVMMPEMRHPQRWQLDVNLFYDRNE